MWLYPGWGLAAIATGVIILFWFFRQRRNFLRWDQYVRELDRPQLQPAYLAVLPVVIVACGVIIAGVALHKEVRAKKTYRHCRPTLVLVDVSISMQAEDTVGGISRLAAAQKFLNTLSQYCRGGSVGLLSFAGLTSLRIPPTDWETLGWFMQEDYLVSYNDAPGSDLENALVNAIELMRHDERAAKTEILLFLSDGGGDGIASEVNLGHLISQLDKKIKIICIGFGGRKLVPMPVYDLKGKFEGWFSINGIVQKTTLNEEPLRYLAQATSGMYFHENMSQQLPASLAEVLKTEVAEKGLFAEEVFYEYPVLGLLVSIAALLILPRRIKRN
jgi:hypothetical protein